MIEYVSLQIRRNRGWPWPESSFGLDPMYGEDGWCHSCGVPRHNQTGTLILQRKGLTPNGAWVPNWLFDVFCVERSLGIEIEKNFRIELRDVGWPATPPGDASQVLVPIVGPEWFAPAELATRALARNRFAGNTCPECGVWKWSPLPFDRLPPFKRPIGLDDFDIASSPEWFGVGLKAYREVVVRRELAEKLVNASPRDFQVAEIDWEIE